MTGLLPRVAVAAGLFLAIAATVPRWWCGRDGQRWFDGDADLAFAHAREVAAVVREGVSPESFTAQGDLFKHEWQFGTYQMAALAFLQLARAHPERRDEFVATADLAIAELLSPRVRAFDAAKWREDPLDTLETSTRGHAAYLGYLNVVLSLHRATVPGSAHAALNDRISAALVRRVEAAPHGIVETYPHEGYPVDNAPALGSVLLRCRAVGEPVPPAVEAWRGRFRRDWRDPASGLLFQAIDPRFGDVGDGARASGSALAAYLVSFGDRELARELHEAVRRECAGSLLGFGFTHENPRQAEAGRESGGDIDSGPLIFGISPSGTGFSLAAARMFGDRERFVAQYRTAHLMGAPARAGDRFRFATGGPLGNAILLAMFTAEKEATP